MMRTIIACLAALPTARGAGHNVLFIFTDDQDLTLGSLDVMPKLKTLVTDKGAFFSNAFVSTPICCPSRAEVLTGRYMHNTKVAGNNCGGTAFIEGPETFSVAHFANESGYTTYYSGKYLNNYGQASVGGGARIPRGWHEWHALYGNSKFYNYKVSNNGIEESYGKDYYADYYTDKLKNDSSVWIRNDWDVSSPFFMIIGSPCSHVPNDFAPQYADMFKNVTAPRLPNWNVAPASSEGPSAKHWMMRNIGPMDETHIQNSDLIFQDRWRCLQSVDDMVEELVSALEERGQLDNTYIVYSSDHGQHLGQFGMGFDKRQLYETDVRVPLLVRGPGISPGQTVSGMAAHVDLAVTFLDMMGVSKPEIMDGVSWLPLVTGRGAMQPWRRDLLIEYGGPEVPPTAADEEEYADQFELHLALHLAGSTDCGIGFDCRDVGMCGGEHGKCACDAKNNTYRCLRTINGTEDSMFCEFDDHEGFVEWYDLQSDPYQLTNLATSSGDPAKRAALHERLRDFMLCHGDYCFDPPAGGPPPAPVPPGFEMYQKDDKCLRCSGSCMQEQERLVLGDCSGMESAWKSSVDPLNFPQIATSSSAMCLNVDSKNCIEGSHVWLHACQGSDSKVHKANHFKFDAEIGAIRSTYCDDERGGNLCLSSDTAADGGLVLANCSAKSAKGFVQQITTTEAYVV